MSKASLNFILPELRTLLTINILNLDIIIIEFSRFEGV